MKVLCFLFPAELEHFNYDTRIDGLSLYQRIEHLR